MERVHNKEMKKGKQNQASTEKMLSTQPKRSQKAVLRKVFPSLLAYVSQGKPVKAFLDIHALDWETLMRALDDRPDLREQYQRARRYQVESYVSEIVPMSDAVIGEEMSVVTATRNAVDARKWVAGKLAPREYGDQPAGVTINNQTNVVVVSEDKLRALQALRQQMLSSPSAQTSPVSEA
jgi:Bacteriophage Sf6, terminase small subunit-like